MIKELAGGRNIPEVYGLDEAGFFDEFFYFPDPSVLYLCLQKKAKRRNNPVSLCVLSVLTAEK